MRLFTQRHHTTGRIVTIVTCMAALGAVAYLLVATSLETSDLRAKYFLATKYNPGSCFGMPAGSPNPSLFDSLFSPAWRKVSQQISQITVTRTAPNAFAYSFENGGCCLVITLTGRLSLSPNGQISDFPASQVTRSEPC